MTEQLEKKLLPIAETCDLRRRKCEKRRAPRDADEAEPAGEGRQAETTPTSVNGGLPQA